MKIVNRSGIPEPIFKLLCVQFYDADVKGDSYSATQLEDPVQKIMLEKRHNHEIEVEASSLLYACDGSSFHLWTEKERGVEPIVRLFTDVLGRRVSGKFDRIADNKIYDYKKTSVWSVIYKSKQPAWRSQLSIYRWLYWKNYQKELESTGYIIAYLRDWTEKEVGTKNYPNFAMIEIPIRLHSLEQTEKLVTERVQALIDAEKLPDDQLPKCTNEERWYRNGIYMRCERYCNAKQFCHQIRSEDLFETSSGGR